MTRPKLPAMLLDPADRRILAIGLVLMFAFLLACIAIGAGLGLGMRAYLLAAGG